MFGGGKSFTLFRVRGIRITVDWSWFLVLFVIIFLLSDFYGTILGQPNSSTEPYLLAVASAAGFFGSIVLHELGHAFVALRNGIGISRISLWFFGGIAQMDRESDGPGTEFKVAIGGPAVTFLIAVVLSVIGVLSVGWSNFMDAIEVKNTADMTGVIAMVAWLAAINVIILGFNLLPAFPMDGGRIVRAIAWKVTGKRGTATRFAAGMGRIFGYIFIGLGLYLAYRGDVFSGIWLAMIGVLITGSARAAAQQTQVTSALEDVKVSDVMDEHPVAIPAALTVDRALEEYFLRYQWSWFPVVDDEQRFVGMVLRDDLDAIPEIHRGSEPVVAHLDAGSITSHVNRDAMLENLLGNPNLRKFGALMVTDQAGRLAGVVTIEQLGRALRP